MGVVWVSVLAVVTVVVNASMVVMSTKGTFQPPCPLPSSLLPLKECPRFDIYTYTAAIYNIYKVGAPGVLELPASLLLRPPPGRACSPWLRGVLEVGMLVSTSMGVVWVSVLAVVTAVVNASMVVMSLLNQSTSTVEFNTCQISKRSC
eukprot:EG_transcript_37077